MRNKAICILLAAVIAAFGLSACGSKDEAEMADTAVQTVITGGEEDGQNPVMNFIGNYQSDRRTMFVSAEGMDRAKITVDWSSDAWTRTQWTMSGIINEDGDGLIMHYGDGVSATITTDEDGNETRSDEKTGGKGVVYFKSDGTIVWTDDQNEEIKDVVFEYVPNF